MMLKKLFLFLLIQQSLFAQTTQNFRGSVKELNTNKNIVGANLQLRNTSLSTQSDSNGVFRFNKIPTGRYVLEISCIGFETILIPEVLLDAGKETVLDVQLHEKTTQLNEAIVKAVQPKSLSSIDIITKEQVLRFPATFFDPARLAASFAGVSNDNDQANGMVIRGNSPNLMQWRLEGVEIVNPNHLSNAGTFADRPAQNSGGVNAISAQLLGTTQLLKGALPAQYGNALSGVMDMSFRKGNNEQHEFTAQAGLIGLDFSAEGPFSKKGKSSYLINYRYSFTGLLGAMGVSFGGEDIRFQDLSFNLSFPNKTLGDFTVFGIFGKNSNDFKAPTDPNLMETEKDKTNIYYDGEINITGLTHKKSISSKLFWNTTLAISRTDQSREEYPLYEVSSYDKMPVKHTEGTHITKQSVVSNFKYALNSHHALNIGAEINLRSELTGEYNNRLPYGKTWASSSLLQLQSYYANWSFSNAKFQSVIGMRLSSSYRKFWEPRASFQYHFKLKQHIFVAVSSQSALISATNLIHVGLGHQVQLSPSRSLKTELFYQLPTNGYCSAHSANAIAAEVYGILDFNTKNYGIESSYQQFLDKGFYLLLNGTLYQASTKYNKNVERPSRYDGRFATNLTTGKEWTKTKNRIFGLNLRVIYRGGFRETPINVAASAEAVNTVFSDDIALAWSMRQANYFRPDLSVYLKKNKAGYTRTLSLDIQNVANYQNQDLSYYDHYLNKVTQRKQLGVIPVLNYRVNF